MTGSASARIAGSAFAAAAALAAGQARAAGPEQLEQIEPAKGDWQLEYYGEFGSDGRPALAHSFEVMHGLSDRLAIGAEAEFERSADGFVFEEAGLAALLRLTGTAEGAGGTGALVTAAVGVDGVVREAEARLIAARRTDRWWGQANLMIRHARGEADEDGAGDGDENEAEGTLLAYSWSARRRLGRELWLGIDGSGQSARLSGFTSGFVAAHFAGPSIATELEAGDSEFEIGADYMIGFGRENPADRIRLTAQLTF